MNFRKLLSRSLIYHRKTHLWVVLGTAVSTAILVGALVIGDSVRFSLRRIVFDRLGRTEFALTAGDRFFRAQIADDLSNILDTVVAPVLYTRGIAIAEGGGSRVNKIQVLGVDARFGEMGKTPDFYEDLTSDEVIVNRYLASRLGLETGDEILLRIDKLDFMPKDAPLALDSESSIARRFRIRSIASDTHFGRFNLKADQVAPLSAYVSLDFLSEIMDMESRANTLLVAERKDQPLSVSQVNKVLKQVWTLADAGLKIVPFPERNLNELRSERIFLDSSILAAAHAVDKNIQPILTYFVTEFRNQDRSTPYSFVSAPGSPVVPDDLKENEIIINDWLAEDLGVAEGDNIQLAYFILGQGRELLESISQFNVKAIVPLKGIYADRDLLPDFPGLSGIENTRDWRPGVPVDLEKIRDKDEDYWYTYRGTPKAFVTFNTAKKLWQNRFGEATAVRFENHDPIDLQDKLTGALEPDQQGFVFREVKKQGLRAGAQSVDFAQLFLGLSFFIIVAALLLTGILFIFNVENRSEENGLFLALGFTRKAVKRFVLLEGAVLIFAGSLLGGLLGIFYNQVLLYAMKTVWRDIVGTSALRIHLEVLTIVLGIAIGVILAFLVIWIITSRQMKHSISGLQKGIPKIETLWKKKPRKSFWISILSVLSVVLIFLMSDIKSGKDAFAFFFTAGTLLLTAGIAMSHVLLHLMGKRAKKLRLNLVIFGIRNNTRRRIRSLGVIGLLASGIFIVFTVGANRNSTFKDAEKRGSGTGGFAFYGESVLPVLYDLNSKQGAQYYGLDDMKGQGVNFVPFRVKEGDDASCLNLNRVSNPQLIGVDPDELAKRNSFSLMKFSEEVDSKYPWSVLDQTLSDGSIPGIADNTVIVWGLGKSVGDYLEYIDEKGLSFKIKLVGGLANSIFQGNIIVSEKYFLQKYPSISGYRMFLVDAPFDILNDFSKNISWAMQDQGMDLVQTAVRLAEFSQIENTYLSIFLILGSFGLMLGSIGIGIVVWRNINERQGEIALLRAVGFKQGSIRALILSEYIVLLVAGIIYGVLAALIATLPSLLTPGTEIPYLTMLALFIAVLTNGFVWVFTAVFFAGKKDLLPALRNE